MRVAVRIMSALLAVLPAAVLAKDLPNLDAFAPTQAAQQAASPRKSNSPLVKPGSEIQYESRLGVPTFLWASKEASASKASLARWSTSPEQAARNYLADFSSFYRLSPQDAASAVLQSVHDTGKGAIIVKFHQSVGGVEVFRDEINVVMNQQREVVALTGYLSPHGAAATAGALAPKFRLAPEAAIARAFEDLNGSSLSPGAFYEAGKAKAGYSYFQLNRALPADNGATLNQPARIKQIWFELGKALEPAYYVELDNGPRNGTDSDAYAYVVSANDGGVLWRKNLTEYDAYTYRVWADSSGKYIPFDDPAGNDKTPTPSGVPDGYQAPFLPPSDVTLQNSPFSKNDPWLPAGATETAGNNVDAYADLFAPDGRNPVATPADPATGDFRAQATGPNAFTHTYDTAQAPYSAEQRQAAVTQMFFVVNFLHDWYYDYGFDEAAGNAQASNFGRGGLENDRIHAEGQDYSGRNNANMSTPADGASPRMQMYAFDPNTRINVTITSPASIAGVKSAGTAAFGAQVFNLTGDVVYAQPANGCAPITNVTGKIALIDRGVCPFIAKAQAAQDAGAVGVLIANNTTGTINMSGSGPITIPVLSVLQTDGAAIKSALGAGTPVSATLLREAGIDRDGTIDNMIISHEWGHYISNRLIVNASGLANVMGRGMGEGWADFNALLMSTKATDSSVPSNPNWTGAFPVSTYVTSGAGNNGYYFGIRRVPYSIDFGKDPFTYKHIQNGVALPTTAPIAFGLDGSNNAEVHNTGEVWATMLWECYASLLRDSARLTFAQAQDRMKAYVVAAYKMTPANPTLLEARDAVLAAAYAGDLTDYQRFGLAFARRGAGIGAIAPDRFSTTHVGVVESYSWGLLPDFSLDGDGVYGCDHDGVLDHGEEGRVTVHARNVTDQTLSHTTATLTSDNPAIRFANGGVIQMPSSKPGETVTGTATVTVGAAPARFTTFTVSLDDPANAPSQPIQRSLTAWTNLDLVANSSATDSFEGKTLVWTSSGAPGLGTTGPWQRATNGSGGYALGPDPDEGSDQYFISPALNVAATGSFGFTFRHRFDFERDSTGAYDGGRIEISKDGGATWSDIGGSATPTYNGVLASYDGDPNPLAGLSAYVGNNASYPGYDTVTVNLGTAYQGQTVQIRFRVGADLGGSAIGWEVDDVAFTGITNTPFPLATNDRAQCVNVRPVANAGANQTVDERALVLLDGTATSDADGDALTYQWTQTGGPTVALSRATTPVAYFTAPDVTAGTQLTFALVATDAAGNASLPAATTVTVRNLNRAPVANAGTTATVDERASATLDGSGSSDPDGDALTYAWTQTGGSPTVALTGATTAKPTFSTPEVAADTALTFSLVVRDGALSSPPATVTVIVRNVNRAPVANAGSGQTVNARTVVTLDGSGSSDPDGDTLHYTWLQTLGPTVALSSATAGKPTFTAPQVTSDTTLAFSLLVDDGKALSATSTVAILVKAVNRPPTADAGAVQTVDERTLTTLHGAGVDPDNDALTYTWAQTGGPAVALSSAGAASPSFIAPEVSKTGATLTFTLTVSDGTASATSTTTVAVKNANHKPRASAGAAQTVDERSTATLSGVGSADQDGDELQYTWTQVAGPTVTLTGGNGPAPTFTAPEVSATTKLTFKLVVSDGTEDSDAVTVDVTVKNVNRQPTANAGGDQAAASGTTVTLHGNDSSDPDATPLTYAWKQTGGPEVALSDATVAEPTFTAPKAAVGTVLAFELTVTDDAGATSTATTHVTMGSAPGGCGCVAAGGESDASTAVLPVLFLGTAYVLARRRRSA